ncbi:MAG: NADH-quinone oxidoreductase subunit L, partial [Syntrophorhabdus sp.]
MLDILWLIPALPFMGFAILVLGAGRIPQKYSTLIGTGTVGISAIIATIVTVKFMVAPPVGSVYVQKLWTWLHAGNFSADIALYLDPLSVVMVLVVTWVSFLILVYSIYFMAGDDGYGRFFAYMDL